MAITVITRHPLEIELPFPNFRPGTNEEHIVRDVLSVLDTLDLLRRLCRALFRHDEGLVPACDPPAPVRRDNPAFLAVVRRRPLDVVFDLSDYLPSVDGMRVVQETFDTFAELDLLSVLTREVRRFDPLTVTNRASVEVPSLPDADGPTVTVVAQQSVPIHLGTTCPERPN